MSILRTSLLLSTLAAPAMAQIDFEGICAKSLQDQAGPGCLMASSAPALGLLYPLSLAFYVSPDDSVGVGTVSPNSRFHVNGDGAGGEDLLRVQRNGSTRLFMDAEGRLGVGGFFDPATALEVMGQTLTRDDSASLARALEASSTSTGSSSSNFGVISFVNSSNGTALRGRAMNTGAGTATGVHGDSLAVDGIGVFGEHRNTNGVAAGVEGISFSDDSFAVGTLGTIPNAAGFSAGVRGINEGTAGLGIGVWGSHDGQGWGVYGTAPNGGIGVLGSAASGGTAVFAAGDFAATGTKSFVQPHPEDPSKEIAFVCLEGNESGTYCRGEGALVGGLAVIQVPEDFRLASEAIGLTIQTTAIGARADLWVEALDLNTVVVRSDQDVTFHWFLNGVRRGFAEHRTIRENQAFRPAQGAATVGAELPLEARELLVRNGILNPDHTLNLDTAARLGWDVSTSSEPSRARPTTSPLPTPAPVLVEER